MCLRLGSAIHWLFRVLILHGRPIADDFRLQPVPVGGFQRLEMVLVDFRQRLFLFLGECLGNGRQIPLEKAQRSHADESRCDALLTKTPVQRQLGKFHATVLFAL